MLVQEFFKGTLLVLTQIVLLETYIIFLARVPSSKNKIWYPQVHDPHIHITGPLFLCNSTLIKENLQKYIKAHKNSIKEFHNQESQPLTTDLYNDNNRGVQVHIPFRLKMSSK